MHELTIHCILHTWTHCMTCINSCTHTACINSLNTVCTNTTHMNSHERPLHTWTHCIHELTAHMSSLCAACMNSYTHTQSIKQNPWPNRARTLKGLQKLSLLRIKYQKWPWRPSPQDSCGFIFWEALSCFRRVPGGLHFPSVGITGVCSSRLAFKRRGEWSVAQAWCKQHSNLNLLGSWDYTHVHCA